MHYIVSAIALLVGFHWAAAFISKKMGIKNKYPGMKERLERGEALPIAILKYIADIYIWGLKVVFVLAVSMFTRPASGKSYFELEAEREANAQKMVDDYGGQLSDYL